MNGAAVECGTGYFLVGDDSVDSQDSRWEGPFPPARIVGRALWVVAPAARRGWVR
jgi:type IV secretory pathway protease TraF